MSDQDNDHRPIASSLFSNEMDQKQFRSIYSSMQQSKTALPMYVIKEISEYSVGSFIKCDNFKHCQNKISQFFRLDNLCTQMFDKGTGGTICVASNCVERCEYYYDCMDDRYFCGECISKKGTSTGLKFCGECHGPMISNKNETCDCPDVDYRNRYQCTRCIKICSIHKVQGCRNCHYAYKCKKCENACCTRDISDYNHQKWLECAKGFGLTFCEECLGHWKGENK